MLSRASLTPTAVPCISSISLLALHHCADSFCERGASLGLDKENERLACMKYAKCIKKEILIQGFKSWGFSSCPFQKPQLGNLFSIPNTELELSGGSLQCSLPRLRGHFWPSLCNPFPWGASAKAAPMASEALRSGTLLCSDVL